MQYTKKELLSYLVDVKGFGEEEAQKEVAIYGGDCIKEEEKREFEEFTK